MKKCVNGVYIQLTDEEMAQTIRMEREIASKEAMREPTAEERIEQLEEQNAMLLECVLEMSMMVYA